MDANRPVPRINALATVTPACEIDSRYRQWAAAQISNPRDLKLFQRMSARSGIECRYTVLGKADSRFEPDSFYATGKPPSTAERMAIYAREAPDLALRAIAGLPDTSGITHVVIASCTGFLAPGLDQIIARRLDLDAGVERISIGFMGCYAGITALRTAAHLVRSNPQARVLTVALELCSLHLQETDDLEALLAMSQFGDGAAAALVTGTGEGLAIHDGISATLEDCSDLMSWTIGDTGFVMHLSGAVPARFADALDDSATVDRITGGREPGELGAWAVHPGGRSVLDAVERSLGLPQDRLDVSRSVLSECGNMSSATVFFVLERLMDRQPEHGVALAFGPGLAMEGFHFGWTGDAG